MDIKAGIVMLVCLITLPSALAANIGVIQDYMEDGVVKVPQGTELVCHSISPATDPSIELSAVKIEVKDLPVFVTADLNADGVYPTTKGHGKGVTFFIRAPKDSAVGTEWHVSFTVSGTEQISEGMVPLTGKIGSGFTIRIVNSTDDVPLPKCTPTVNTVPETIVNKEKYFPTSTGEDKNDTIAGVPITIGGKPKTDDSTIMGLNPLVIVGGAAVVGGAIVVSRRRKKVKAMIPNLNRPVSQPEVVTRMPFSSEHQPATIHYRELSYVPHQSVDSRVKSIHGGFVNVHDDRRYQRP